ncbi:MAG: hypothetical protein KGK01_04265 [Bradyrhizobium sp.]|uniref:hypothetical protein n=1 Tax=Bradyrhizobium sp. TaxID=376 RepID=UPI002399E9CD|nr:hypothetical protein [Bradyrhizobium sp.]MDE2068862.1 hypothetical protein [Bradyrhizobium sp.]MDE2241672.1 hypothetical protein [Bradyrhizobium sp.]MDE2470412.1 hypothetical protein [Bradyrhizobium sp.]
MTLGAMTPFFEAVLSLLFFLAIATPCLALVAILALVTIVYLEERNWKVVGRRLLGVKRGSIPLNISTEIRDVRTRYNEKWETIEFRLLLAIAALIFFNWTYASEQLDHFVISLTLGLALIKKVSGRVVHYIVVKRDHTGISKLRKQALLKWLSIPLSIQNVRFASFEDDDAFGSKSIIKSYSAVLDRIIDREEAEHPFTSEDRSDLYRRWLYSGQRVLSAYVDSSEQPLAATVVMPLTKSAYEQYRAGSLDALDIQPHHILPRPWAV